MPETRESTFGSFLVCRTAITCRSKRMMTFECKVWRCSGEKRWWRKRREYEIRFEKQAWQTGASDRLRRSASPHVIYEVQWRRWRHCHNTSPCWRYTLCEQQLCKMRKSWHSMQKLFADCTFRQVCNSKHNNCKRTQLYVRRYTLLLL